MLCSDIIFGDLEVLTLHKLLQMCTELKQEGKNLGDKCTGALIHFSVCVIHNRFTTLFILQNIKHIVLVKNI